MTKKILSVLLVMGISITGLFAYEAPSTVILNATMTKTDYQFKLQQFNDNLTSFTDYTDSYTQEVVLDTTGGETNQFGIATNADGNMGVSISFKTTVTTGEFLAVEADAEVQSTGWFPVIVDYSSSVNNARNEEVVFDTTNSVDGAYKASSIAYYTTEFKPGKHVEGTEIARFSLKYKGDDEIVAGSYTSTTIVEIAAE
jgi:hypothetical protein